MSSLNDLTTPQRMADDMDLPLSGIALYLVAAGKLGQSLPRSFRKVPKNNHVSHAVQGQA
ncbi:MAG: hypothetical protein U0571_07315 [Candidatus Brocadia sapporoensis]